MLLIKEPQLIIIALTAYFSRSKEILEARAQEVLKNLSVKIFSS